jgi:hypothetical protein
LSPDEWLKTYVRQHHIVDIEFDHAEYNEDDNIDDSDKDEGVDFDEDAFFGTEFGREQCAAC